MSQVRALAQTLMTTLQAGKHNPNSNHSSEVFRKIIKFKRNAVSRKNEGYVHSWPKD